LIEEALRTRTAAARPLLEVAGAGLRVKQWTKNLLLFAGLLFAAKLSDGSRWVEAWAVFFVYCAASSAAYLVNDVRDAERDRLHPVKRRRPVAAGSLSPRTALLLAVVLAAAAFAGAVALGPAAVAFVAGFLTLQLAYSFGLKLVVGLDVFAIAALFTVRAAAGAEAVHVRVSPWLLACTAVLAVFLALAKRRGELAGGSHAGRRVLAHYSLPVLDRLLPLVAVVAVGLYSAYAFAARDSLEMGLTIPFVVAALVRYLVLVRRDGLGERPEEVLLTDAPILLAVGSWALTAALVLALT
jgi:4-hydroxybenzoate polyprenyltransferase